MDPIGDDLLKVMEPELGYRERAGQHTTFGEWYSTSVARDPQYKTAPWCDMVIAWAAEKAGIADFVGQFAWTPSHARWFETRGAWSTRPEPGALVFFDWSGGKDIKGIDHVGIVESVDGGTLHTIEGNVDGVWLKRKTRDEDKVVGYGLPRKVREKLAGVSSGNDTTVLPAAGRAGAHPGLALASPAAPAVGRAGTPPFPPETAPLAGVLLLVLGAALILARRRPSATVARRSRAGVGAPSPGPAEGRSHGLADGRVADPVGERARVLTGGRHRRQGRWAAAATGPGGDRTGVPVGRQAPRQATRHVSRQTTIEQPRRDTEPQAALGGPAARTRLLRSPAPADDGVPASEAVPRRAAGARAGRRPYSSPPAERAPEREGAPRPT
ncbi:CHAP domain-containing protein [Streptosporangium sp. CA-135522]|uniref:CHAP domain-containing protein n=1 Tax=Streptosporangium sp. CA-135522 TaxID=3240072 RepID=UPI003D8C5B75